MRWEDTNLSDHFQSVSRYVNEIWWKNTKKIKYIYFFCCKPNIVYYGLIYEDLIYVHLTGFFIFFVAHSPYLSVCGGSLSDDGAGLRRRQGLLDHYAGVMTGHPRVGLLVLALACLAVQGDVLWREKGEYMWLEKTNSLLKYAFDWPCVFEHPQLQ